LIRKYPYSNVGVFFLVEYKSLKEIEGPTPFFGEESLDHKKHRTQRGRAGRELWAMLQRRVRCKTG